MNKEFDTFLETFGTNGKIERSTMTEGLPKNISIEEFCTKHGVDFPTFDKWYRKTHKRVYPVVVTIERLEVVC